MRSPKIRVRGEDSDTLYRATELSFTSSRTIKTPFAVSPDGGLAAKWKWPQQLSGLAEIYRVFPGGPKLDKLMDDPDVEAPFVKGLQRSVESIDSHEGFPLFIPAVDRPFTETKQIEYIADTTYAYGDVISVPSLTKPRQLFREDAGSFSDYIDFVNAFIEDIERLNNKVILGMIPPVAYNKLQPLIDLYLEKEIHGFAIDLDCKSPSAEHERNLRPLLKTLKDHGLKEESFLYALNAQTGRPGPQTKPGIQPAQDVLAYGFGFDILGLKHRAKPLSKDAMEAMKKAGPKIRFFNRNQYAYQAVPLHSAGFSLPQDTSIQPEIFQLPSQATTAAKLVSREQLTIESSDLYNTISGGDVHDHLTLKGEITEETIKKLKRVKKATAQQSSLDNAW